MGPANWNFYTENNLIDYEELKYSKICKAWITLPHIKQNYCAGRIDISGVPDEPYGVEYGLPLMKAQCWQSFSEWLWHFRTETLLSFDDLIAEYEKINPKIEWFNDENK